MVKLKKILVLKTYKVNCLPTTNSYVSIRELTDFSLPKIGEEFGGRDHTTVIHAHEKMRK